MKFNDHSRLAGAHAFLGPSKYHWVNYDEDKLVATFRNTQAVKRGVALHEYAQKAISLGIRQKQTRQTLNMYINDAIGYGMSPEQVVFYSINAFGTVDAISFRDGMLRIHDLKTGVTATSMKQPYIYAALFCLEYDIRPGTIETELRIYQKDVVLVETADVETVALIMDKIISFDKRIEELKAEGA